MELDNKTIRVWNKAKNCNCNQQDCEDNHKLCGICNKKVIYGAHESIKEQINSSCRWNLDHKKPKSKGGTDKEENLQVVHVKCNTKKGNK